MASTRMTIGCSSRSSTVSHRSLEVTAMRSFAHRTERIVRRVAVGATILAVATRTGLAQTAADYQRAVTAAYEKYKNLHEGKNADYIPALAKVNPDLFGIALVTPDGKVYTAGDVSSQVSIQSVSKVFTMARVFQQSGEKAVEDNIGVDATGQAFNSIIAIEQFKGKEMNPLVNPGAITTTSMIDGDGRQGIWKNILAYYSEFAARPL